MVATGRIASKTSPVLSSGAVISANGSSTGQDLRGVGEVIAILDVLVVAGSATPTLNVKLQVCQTLNGTYVDIPGGAFTAVTAAGRQTLKLISDIASGFVRETHTVSGTGPQFTTALNLVGLQLHDSVIAEAI
jgi:hypothetical protein